MWARLAALILAVGSVGATGGCATSTEWTEWRVHTTHFVSGQHGTFSLRNSKDGSAPRVTRSDVEAARTESWWGRAITVRAEQILQ
jgi:hypothetical protein